MPLVTRHRALIQALASVAALLYVFVFSFFILRQGGWPTPDFLIPPLIFIALIYGRGWRFVLDWTPFLVLILAYEAFRGFAPELNARVHVTGVIEADRWLAGGVVPTNWLQDHFYHPGDLRWYDWLATGMHAAHFAVPVCYAFIIWLADRKLYWRYMVALLGLSFAGFATYLAYPAAPPWMASDMGLIPPVTRVLGYTLGQLSHGTGMTLTYQYFSPNEVAAMPSLHAASPLLLALVAIASHGKKALPLLLYPIVGGIAWMYLGEHYLIDVLVGYVYGAAAFVIFWLLLPVAVERWRLGESFGLPRLPRLRTLPAWPLAAGAAALAIFGWVRLAPLSGSTAPVQANAVAAAAPILAPEPAPSDCSANSTVAPGADDLLDGLSNRYAAFVQALGSPTCFALSDQRGFEPLGQGDLDRVREAVDGGLSFFPISAGRGITYVQVGKPSQALLSEPGITGTDSYAVVIRVNRSAPGDDVRRAVSDIAGLALGPSQDGN
jgi:hypothetical protein